MRTRAASTLVLLLAVVLAAGCTLLPAPSEEPAPGAPVVTRAEVTRHTDGDTARFRLATGAEEKVRFIGIDTPEVGERAEPFGEEAAAYTAGAIPVGTTVWLETDAELRDEYGRLLAYVWLEEPTTGDAAQVRAHMLNAQLVLDGYANAYTYPPNVKYTDVLKDLQAEAREADRGFWAE
ncbi:MAG: thermonuclease family protein [Coriobacteriia bacterium]|nr:thermonuclease family protein [Coriobacteriia bacterium]